MMTGYTHAIFPRVSISFKMGSPMHTVGIINADTSTCIAGWLDRTPDMLPLTSTVLREPRRQTANLQGQDRRASRSLIGPLVQAALANSVDMEGNFPEKCRPAQSPHRDRRAGAVAHRRLVRRAQPHRRSAHRKCLQPARNLVQRLSGNQFKTLHFKSIECSTEIQPGPNRRDRNGTELENDTLAPAKPLKPGSRLRPSRGPKATCRAGVEVAK